MDNRAGEMDVFITAVELDSFSAAGRRLGLSPSAVSKMIRRIEDRLGTRLLVRSTRSLQLTPEGEIYRQRALRILAEIEDTRGSIGRLCGAARLAAGELLSGCGAIPHIAAYAKVFGTLSGSGA